MGKCLRVQLAIITQITYIKKSHCPVLSMPPDIINVIILLLCATVHLLVLPWWCHQIKKIPRYWPFVPGIPRPPVNSPHKGQWRGALVFSLICAWTSGWVNNRDSGDLRRHRPHFEVTVMPSTGMAVLGAHFGAGSGKIWLDEVKCSSTEERLEHCRHAGWGNEDCSHQQDAGVRCSWAHIVIETFNRAIMTTSM